MCATALCPLRMDLPSCFACLASVVWTSAIFGSAHSVATFAMPFPAEPAWLLSAAMRGRLLPGLASWLTLSSAMLSCCQCPLVLGFRVQGLGCGGWVRAGGP